MYTSGYLPPPIRPSQLAQRLLQQTKFDRMAEDGGEVQDVEMEVEEQDHADQATPTSAEGKKEDKGKQGAKQVCEMAGQVVALFGYNSSPIAARIPI